MLVLRLTEKVYNLVTQQDNSINIDIAHQAAQHSSSMNAITILTMVFLPGTFIAVSSPMVLKSAFPPRCFTHRPLNRAFSALAFSTRKILMAYPMCSGL